MHHDTILAFGLTNGIWPIIVTGKQKKILMGNFENKTGLLRFLCFCFLCSKKLVLCDPSAFKWCRFEMTTSAGKVSCGLTRGETTYRIFHYSLFARLPSSVTGSWYLFSEYAVAISIEYHTLHVCLHPRDSICFA